MDLTRPLFCTLLISFAACTAAAPPVAPSVLTLPKEDEPPPAAVGPAPRDLIACMEEARVAAMIAARPGQSYPVAAGCVNVIFENALSANFIVTRVLFMLDGRKLIDRAEAAGTRGPLATIPVFRLSLGPATAGDHTLQVLVDLQGDGTGATAYLQGYRFEVRSSHPFTLASTGGIEIRTILHERNTPPLKFEERPALRYVVTTRAPVAEPAVAAPPVSLPKVP
jgi:hypothetical protein